MPAPDQPSRNTRASSAATRTLAELRRFSPDKPVHIFGAKFLERRPFRLPRLETDETARIGLLLEGLAGKIEQDRAALEREEAQAPRRGDAPMRRMLVPRRPTTPRSPLRRR